MFNVGIGALYQNSTNNMESVWGQKFSNLSGLGLNGDFVLNITGKAWLKFYGEGVFNVSKVNGTVSTQVGMLTVPYSLSSFKDSNYEIQAVVGYDVLSVGIMDWSIYGGLFHKTISHDANFTMNFPGASGSLQQVSSANFTGGVFGTGLTFYAKNVITNIYAEGYVTAMSGKYEAIYTGDLYGTLSGSYKRSDATGGFGIGASTDIEVVDNIWIKPSIKYQMLFSNGVEANNRTFKGNNNFQALTLGLGVSWR
jgi:hypothetical protein